MSTEPFTIEQFKNALPAKMQKSVNPALIAKLQKVFSEPEMFETYRENLVSYTSVMADGRFKLTNYIDAVKYVSHKLRGLTNLDAFTITFPDKIQRWTAQGVVGKDQASYITAYNKSKLVNLIMEQTLVPSWVLNQDLFQQALNIQARLMNDGNVSAKVRSDAANSLLTHLKPPETKKIELDIGVKEDSSIKALRDATMEYVTETRKAIEAGLITPTQAAHATVVLDNDTGEPV